MSLKDESWTRTRNISCLVLLLREATSIFAYWEVDDSRKELLSRHFQREWMHFPLFIRLHDVTDVIFTGENSHLTTTFEVTTCTDNWYFNGVQPGRSYLADLATKTANNNFFTLLRSNTVLTPPMVRQTYSPKVRFASPSVNSGEVPGEGHVSKLDLPWREQFTGYNLVEGKGGRE